MEETRKFAEKSATMPPSAINMAKHAINYGYNLFLDNANVLEIQCNAQCFSTQDQKEGCAAILEGKKPNFIGK